MEQLFFFCYYAYLLGDFDNARMYYEMLKEEFSLSGSPTVLKAHQFSELAKIRLAIRTGNISKKTWMTSSVQDMPAEESSRFRQKELVKAIHTQCLHQLCEILEDTIYLYNIEHPCPPYGIVDMVYMGKNTVYPIEIKKDQGQQDLIGQIGKYDLYHRLRLHYKQYEFVRSVTICRTYQKYVCGELKSSGVTTLTHSGGLENLSIKFL